MTDPETLLPIMYDAVSAVVILTEALTHDALVDVSGTNEIAFAVSAVVAVETLPNTLEAVTQDAVCAVVMNTEAETQDALATELGNGV